MFPLATFQVSIYPGQDLVLSQVFFLILPFSYHKHVVNPHDLIYISLMVNYVEYIFMCLSMYHLIYTVTGGIMTLRSTMDYISESGSIRL